MKEFSKTALKAAVVLGAAAGLGLGYTAGYELGLFLNSLGATGSLAHWIPLVSGCVVGLKASGIGIRLVLTFQSIAEDERKAKEAYAVQDAWDARLESVKKDEMAAKSAKAEQLDQLISSVMSQSPLLNTEKVPKIESELSQSSMALWKAKRLKEMESRETVSLKFQE